MMAAATTAKSSKGTLRGRGSASRNNRMHERWRLSRACCAAETSERYDTEGVAPAASASSQAASRETNCSSGKPPSAVIGCLHLLLQRVQGPSPEFADGVGRAAQHLA